MLTLITLYEVKTLFRFVTEPKTSQAQRYPAQHTDQNFAETCLLHISEQLILSMSVVFSTLGGFQKVRDVGSAL